MREHMTNAFDALGLVAVAAGIGAGSAHWIGWFGLAVAGAVLIGGSLLAHVLAGGESE